MPEAAPVTPVAPAPVANGAPAATPSAEDFLEFTVEGKPEKVTRAEALKRLSKAAYSDRVTHQAKEAIKATAAEKAKWEAEQKLLEDDEEAYLKSKGRDPDKLAQRILERKLAEQGMTADQRQTATEKARADALEKKLAEHTEKSNAAQTAEHTTRIQHLMESELSAAATKAGIAPGADSFYAIYEAVKESVELGLPWDAERIIEVAQGNIDGAFKSLETKALAGLEGDALEKRLGKTVVDKLLAHRLAKIRGKRTFGQPVEASATPAPITPANPYITEAEARANLSKLARGCK